MKLYGTTFTWLSSATGEDGTTAKDWLHYQHTNGVLFRSRHEAETALEQEAKSYNEDLGAYEITERYFKTQGGGFWVKYAEGSEARARIDEYEIDD